MKSIAFILKADSLEQDDRVRKEALSLINLGNKVKIFVNFGDNEIRKGRTSYGVDFESVRLKSRDFFSSSNMLMLKALEFYLKLKDRISVFDIVWVHEEYTFLFSLLNKNQNLVWDLHEYPSKFSSRIGKVILRLCELKSNCIVHANQQRLDKCIEIGMFKNKSNHTVIRNFPDSNFLNYTKINNQTKLFLDWLDGAQYIYLQGLGSSGRYPYNTIASILKSSSVNKYKVVVIGYVEAESKSKLIDEFGDKLFERVFFIGQIEQLEISLYLKNASFSIVLYKSSNINNTFCEPNRLYQAINMGVPVIVGNNITMLDIVSQYKVGVVLNDDGENINGIFTAIDELVLGYSFYRSNSKSCQLLWDESSVDDVLKKVQV